MGKEVYNKYLNKEYAAIIRFLPSKDNENPIIIKKLHYKDKQFINCKDEECTICEEATIAIEKKDMSKYIKLKPKKQYITTIYIKNDFINPENNGKIFLFNFGQAIMDKIIEELEGPISPKDSYTIEGYNSLSILQKHILEIKEKLFYLKQLFKIDYPIWDLAKGKDFHLVKTFKNMFPMYNNSYFDKKRTVIVNDKNIINKIYCKI